jgi:hypothetical protein
MMVGGLADSPARLRARRRERLSGSPCEVARQLLERIGKQLSQA